MKSWTIVDEIYTLSYLITSCSTRSKLLVNTIVRQLKMRRATHLFGTAVRETGQAMDRLGLTISGVDTFKETFSRHRHVMNLYDKRPLLAIDAWVAPNASVIGEVLLLDRSSVWYGSVVRGDKNKIKVGSCSSIQDRTVITTVSTLDSGFPAEVDIGDFVTIGAGSQLTSCTIGNEVNVGAGSIIQEGTVIESRSIVAPGSVVLPDTLIPSGELWAGNPAKKIRDLTEDEIHKLVEDAEETAKLSLQHSEEFLPYGTVYQEGEKLKQ